MAGSQSATAKAARPHRRRRPHRLHGDREQSLIAHTYFGLRWGLAIAAFLLPVVVRWGEQVLTDHSLPISISGYYHTGMRNYFVATLIVIATFLFLYKGFSHWENHLLNLAGIATALLVFFPTACDSGATECASFTKTNVHNTCAIIAFGCIGIVAMFLGGSTLDLLHDKRKERVFRTIYVALGLGMIVFPVLALILSGVDVASIYWVEFAALWVFVGYWVAKTVEFRLTGAEVRAIRGLLPPPTQGPPAPPSGGAAVSGRSTRTL